MTAEMRRSSGAFSVRRSSFFTNCSISLWIPSLLQLQAGDFLHHQVPIKNIERELICPICKELFTHPLILPCQHSVCHKCVKELLMLNHDDSFDAGSESSVSGSPRSRVPSPSMERLDRLVRSGGSRW
ncbi:E3 ubiquitin-protein ligase trim36 [Goodea atripinnis]|uniref:E3 ubiquitin-protein ligase trim36 n=1 Tax=Goodea atripinnis TaxID=208336 RepID=A0ABV0P1M1_9TELE